MLSLADVQPSHDILDPSAGKGDILDAVSELFPGIDLKLSACEINTTLQRIITLKNYALYHDDFLELEPSRSSFDRILMNPPFENGQDADHVTHALSLLAPGGRLVAIVSEGLFFREFKREKAFRALLQKQHAYVSEPIKEGFKNNFISAGVTVRIIAMNQDGSPIETGKATLPSALPYEPTVNTDDLELLELEAEAELELLKMRVEQERRKKQQPLNGTYGISMDKLARLRQRAALISNNNVLDFK